MKIGPLANILLVFTLLFIVAYSLFRWNDINYKTPVVIEPLITQTQQPQGGGPPLDIPPATKINTFSGQVTDVNLGKTKYQDTITVTLKNNQKQIPLYLSSQTTIWNIDKTELNREDIQTGMLITVKGAEVNDGIIATEVHVLDPNILTAPEI